MGKKEEYCGLYPGETADAVILEQAASGKSLKQISKALGVSVSTTRRWLDMFPSFKEAYMEGTRAACGEVENALYRAACGYHMEESETVSNSRGVNTKVTTKYHPPNISAIKMFLSNKMPKDWKFLAKSFGEKKKEEDDEQDLDLENMEIEELKKIQKGLNKVLKTTKKN